MAKNSISLLVIIAMVALWSYLPIPVAQAAGIDDVAVTLSAGGTSAESQISVVFTPTTALIVNDTITLYMGEVSGGDPWVDTDTTIDFNDVTCSGTGYTFDTYVQTDATGTVPLLVSCDVLTLTVGTNAVTVQIGDGVGDDLYNPAGADGYSAAIVTNDDSGAGVAYVGDNNDITVSATVLPNLQLTFSTPDGAACTIASGVITCDLGVITTASENDGSYDIDVGTNATSGATVSLAEDGNLRNGANDINDVGDGDITAASEEYGVILTETGTSWTIDPTYAATEAPVISGPDTAATSSGPVDTGTDNIDVTHRGAVSTSTLALVYSHIVTWTATANF